MFKIVGIISAALAICLIFGGYFVLRHRSAAATAQPAAAPRVEAREPIKLQVFEDEAYLRRADAIIGGTVHNVSNEKLSGLSLTIKLQGRDGRTEETRTVAATPANLSPQEKATYSLAVPSAKWSSAKVVAIAADGSTLVAFQSTRGKARPREAPPAPIVRSAPAERSKASKKDDGFLNTPDTPITIR